MKSRARSERHAFVRHWKAIAFTVIGLVSAYPVAANLFLSLGGVHKLFESTDQVKVDFRRAWSVWPGVVHADGVRVLMKDHNVQFVLEISHADVNIHLPELAHRTFHATRVRATGVVFRFRHRIELESRNQPFVAALAHIPPFQDPPLFDLGPPTPPLDEAHYNLWTVHLDDVDAKVREIWVQMVRYQGEARALGAFRLRPAKRVWVGPAELRVLSGTIATGPSEVLTGVEGIVTTTVDDFDVEPVHGMQPLHFISARVKLSGQVPSLEAANFLSGPSSPVRLSDGSGTLDTDAAIDHGVFTHGSRIAYRTNGVGLAIRETSLHLDGDLEIVASYPPDQPTGRLSANVGAAHVQIEGSKHSPLKLKGVLASLASSGVDVTQDWTFAGAKLDVGALALADLRWLNDLPLLRPRSWSIDGGSGQASGSVTLGPTYDLGGSATANVHAAAGRNGDIRWQATADASASGHYSRLHDGSVTGRVDAGPLQVWSGVGTRAEAARANINMTVSFGAKKQMVGQVRAQIEKWVGVLRDTRIDGSLLSADAQFTPSFVRGHAVARQLRSSALGSCSQAEVSTATLAGELNLGQDGAPLSGNLRGALEAASVLWGEFAAKAALADFKGNWDRSRLFARLESTGLALKNAEGAPKSWQAEAAQGSILADLRMNDSRATGPLRLLVRQVRAQVGATRIGGEVEAELTVSSLDSSRRTGDISGTVQARRVSLSMGRRDVKDWWADFRLDPMHVDASQDFNLTGKVRARFRDGLPMLYVLASEDEIPKWVPTLLPLRGLTLDLGVERFCRWADVKILAASGGPLSAQGRLQTEPGETRGAFLLRIASFKPVSLGLDFVQDYSNSSALVGADWLERHLVPLTAAATEKHDGLCEPQPPKCRAIAWAAR